MRLFIAFELPDRLREGLGRRMAELRRVLPRARWVRPEGLHVTLKFLGETAEGALAGLGAALGPAFAAAPALTARLAGGGCFPPGRPARVAWVGLAVARAGASDDDRAGATADLAALHGRLEEAARAALGVAPEGRPFSPHVTLARPDPPWRREAVEHFAQTLAGDLGSLGEPFAVDHGSLVESRLGTGGARYRTVETYAMGV